MKICQCKTSFGILNYQKISIYINSLWFFKFIFLRILGMLGLRLEKQLSVCYAIDQLDSIKNDPYASAKIYPLPYDIPKKGCNPLRPLLGKPPLQPWEADLCCLFTTYIWTRAAYVTESRGPDQLPKASLPSHILFKLNYKMRTDTKSWYSLASLLLWLWLRFIL